VLHLPAHETAEFAVKMLRHGMSPSTCQVLYLYGVPAAEDDSGQDGSRAAPMKEDRDNMQRYATEPIFHYVSAPLISDSSWLSRMYATVAKHAAALWHHMRIIWLFADPQEHPEAAYRRAAQQIRSVPEIFVGQTQYEASELTPASAQAECCVASINRLHGDHGNV
jgi:hypothetical protein